MWLKKSLSMSNTTPNKNRAKTKSAPKTKHKAIRLAGIGLALIAIVAAAVLTGSDGSNHEKVSGCGPYRTDRIVHINGAAFKAEVASNAAEFEKGLSGRPCIKPDQAMLFAFTQP